MKPASRIGLSIVGLLAVLATAAFIGISIFGGEKSKADKPAQGRATPVPTVAEEPEEIASPPADGLVFDHPGDSTAAEATSANLNIYDSPGGKASRSLKNPTVEGMPLVLGVREDRGDWLLVQLPIRPNNTTGWVKKSDVKTRTIPNHIVVEVAKRRLTAWRGSELLMESPVGVGTPKTPTPPGTYYVDVSAKNPGMGLGAHMLSISGFSNVLRNFGGGVGQLAIHGTSNLASVGAFSSNGCLRLPNPTVVSLAKIAPTGTPVFVLP